MVSLHQKDDTLIFGTFTSQYTRIGIGMLLVDLAQRGKRGVLVTLNLYKPFAILYADLCAWILVSVYFYWKHSAFYEKLQSLTRSLLGHLGLFGR